MLSLAINENTSGFPIAEFAAVYAPKVPVFQEAGWEFLHEPYLASFVSIAAYNDAKLHIYRT